MRWNTVKPGDIICCANQGFALVLSTRLVTPWFGDELKVKVLFLTSKQHTGVLEMAQPPDALMRDSYWWNVFT